MRLPLFLICPVAICLIAAGCSGSDPEKTTATEPADFSLSVTPSSQTLVQGTSGTALSLQATGTNGLASPVTVDVSGLPASVTANPASLTLTVGTAQNVTLTASTGVANGSSTVTFTGTAGALSHTATLALTLQTPAIPDVTTYHFDNSRDGLNAQETVLTPANVTSATFGKIGFFQGDGKIDAQPLYLAGFNVSGTATNVLYMATEHDSVYAFNADTGAQIWKTSLLGSGETTSDDHGCYQISPEIGITSTPVIDRAKGAIFIIRMNKDENSSYNHRLYKINMTTRAKL
jgi:outer membrane protein assembly factor BamB